MGKIKKSFCKFSTFILIALVVVFGYFFYQNKLSSTKKFIAQQQKITVYLKIVGQADFVKHEIIVGKTALDFTREKADIVTKGEKENAYIIGINGIAAQNSKKEFWAFYVNGKMAEVGAGSYKLKEGDKIEWKLANY
ncbi:MAG: DUF4430 domain-containing protein [Patescibacteria group bacterium]